MKKRSAFVQRNLSSIVLIGVYLLNVVIHVFYDSFLLEDQIGLLLAMLPFILVGFALDFILSRKSDLDKGIKTFAQLCPSGIFAMQGITSLLILVGKETIDIFDYLIWLFLALPFFAASYHKDGHKQKLIYSLIGTGLIVAVYMFLTTQSDEMNKGSGAIIYFITYFLLIYSASGIRRMPYLGMVIGILNAAALLWLRYIPMTEASISHGWDYEMYIVVDLLILISLIFSIFVRLLEEILPKEVKVEPVS